MRPVRKKRTSLAWEKARRNTADGKKIVSFGRRSMRIQRAQSTARAPAGNEYIDHRTRPPSKCVVARQFSSSPLSQDDAVGRPHAPLHQPGGRHPGRGSAHICTSDSLIPSPGVPPAGELTGLCFFVRGCTSLHGMCRSHSIVAVMLRTTPSPNTIKPAMTTCARFPLIRHRTPASRLDHLSARQPACLLYCATSSQPLIGASRCPQMTDIRLWRSM